jgi:hypothetical protein
MNENVLHFKIQNSQPIELLDLTKSLSAMADEYRRHLDDLGLDSSEQPVKLLIKEVRAGSIEIDLVDVAAMAYPSLVAMGGDINTIVEFGKHIKACLDYLLKKTPQKPSSFKEARRLQNLSDILEPIAKDPNATMTIRPMVININGANSNVVVQTMESNAAQNEIGREISQIKKPVKGFEEKVLLRWYQTRNDAKSKIGDKGIVESITGRPVKTIFSGDSLKNQMLQMDDNFYRRAFLVDIQIDTINGRPALYKIIAIHDTIDISDLGEDPPK